MRIVEQCEIVAALIAAMRPIYAAANERQRSLLETIIGAGIWYIPKPTDAWTGNISLNALRSFHPDSGVVRPKLSEEHVYPRKVTAKKLLQTSSLSGAELADLFRAKYGRVHLITAEENKAVQPFQRVGVFVEPEAAYAAAGVRLIELSETALRQVKKRDRAVIDELLSGT